MTNLHPHPSRTWPQVPPLGAAPRAKWPAGCDHLPRATAALRRKLHAAELTHLREHCAELAERIDALERELRDAQAIAEQWQSEAEALREDADAHRGVVLLHRDGNVAIAYGEQS